MSDQAKRPSRTVHADRAPEPVIVVSGWCDLGERLVEKVLTGAADGRLVAHLEQCPRCAEVVAS